MEEYPQNWDDYIGQEQTKRLLRKAAESARKRNAPMDHVLIACPDGGVGKTALAHLIAMELGSNMHTIAEAIETTAARRILEEMYDFDVLFIDEIHRFKRVTWLHHLLQDGKIAGRGAKLGEAPRITIIGATTDPNKLDSTILGRFQYSPVLVPLTLDEATTVGEVMSRKIFEDVQAPLDGCLRGVATAANFNPRVIKQLLRTIRDLAITEEISWIEGYGWELDTVLEFRGLHYDGLSHLSMKYLEVLRTAGGQAGQENIASILGERDGLAGVERLLMGKGLVERDRGGRLLTRKGRERLREQDEFAA